MILVTGATGNVGRNVVEQLLAEGQQVRALSRRPEQAGLPEGVEVLRGDLAEPDTLPAAVAGVDRAFLFPVHGQLPAFLDAARHAGVRHVVLLSSLAVSQRSDNLLGRTHADSERVVAESGIPWTVLRPGAFMANDLRWAPGIRSAGVVRAPFGAAVTAPIDERDIATVAVRALLDDGHAGRTYELTGPEPLTQVDRVRILGEVLGQDLRFAEQSRDEARQQMTAVAPAELVDALLDTFAAAVGAQAPVRPTVAEVTGRAPSRYAQWAAHHAAAFR
jgi:uncharacterized protein YbjT (DUF2867 family)